MNHPAPCPQASLSPHPLVQLWHVIAARWATHLEDARKAREFDFMHDLSADTLRDIGAPEQWVTRATARSESQQLRLGDLRQWRDG